MKSPNSESNFPMSNFENVSPNENPVNYSHETVTEVEKEKFIKNKVTLPFSLSVHRLFLKYYP